MLRADWKTSPIIRQLVLDEYIRGDSVVEIARRHHVSPTYVWQVRTAAGIPSRRRRKVHSRVTKEAALAAFLSGVKLEAIEAEFGISRNTIYSLTSHRRRANPTKGVRRPCVRTTT